ncbi:MAG: TonB-dependent receptor [Bacteroidetes bacterium CG02_land_8_20_14_3_00_31_25]|nr:TonB-dependent receptor [Bacteroidota bacterium]PIV63064.1 MAG: TonB-dependent receptor [Bacteroidetes bacterium CG02_land_8_20_14_3_00_31_25]PIY02846.1 MAG: TonB-dependent receptor [Bacteroidetes bacterium CG_4_10_14_3_um_filter_31_20]
MKNIFLILLISFFFLSNLNSQNLNDTTFSENKVYHLGEVVVSAKNSGEIVSQSEMQKFNNIDVATSINILPSITLCNVGARNESTVYIRGFDLRSVPVFVDGIPVYVPYDGYVDLARFTNFDLSKIEISKGYSSILYGANTIGGSINLISSKPTKKIEINLKAGVLSGNGFITSANIGSKIGKFYFQGNFSKLDRQYYTLSKDFDTTKNETDWKRDNSYRNDNKASIKIGFTPHKTDEYSINYIYQHGEKGNPIYLGEDKTIKVRYWQWPLWDKQSLYFISKTTFVEKNYIKTRLFYDKFINKLNSYDNNTYSTQTKPYSFTSYYNDFSYGGNIETGTEIISKNILKFAVHFKSDTHRENNESEPVRNFSDNTFSFGLEDEYTPFNKLKFIPGISYNMRNSLIAEDYNSQTHVISNFPENKNNATNAQIAVYYKFSDNFNLSLTTAHKTRFATMKDRYSYRMGTAIPNPDLKAETAMNYEIASHLKLNDKITFEPAIFYSQLNNTIQMVSNFKPSISQQQNTGKAEFYGADYSISYKVLINLMLNANYTFIQRNNITNPDIKFTDVPKHKIFAYIDYLPFKNFEFIFSTEYNSYRFSTSYGTISPEFVVFNSQISYIIAKYLKVETGINNILDKNYSLIEGYSEEGRNFYFSLIFNFKK